MYVMKKVVKLAISAKASYANIVMGCGKRDNSQCGISQRAGQ
jgi:hypothetical protein